jgi:Na+/H+ antiporter NhaC
MENNISSRKGLLALSPLVVFLCVYLVSSIIAKDFYCIPISSAFLIATIYAMAISKGKTLEEKISTFSAGAGNKSVLLMIWIFAIAGAVILIVKRREVKVYITGECMDPRCVRGFFLNSGFIVLAVLMLVNMLTMVMPI